MNGRPSLFVENHEDRRPGRHAVRYAQAARRRAVFHGKKKNRLREKSPPDPDKTVAPGEKE
jgi:hypothetical protein